MNNINDNEINQILRDELDFFKNKYGNDRILGAFCYGKANAGLAKTEDDIKVECIYLPTFEDACLPDRHLTYDTYVQGVHGKVKIFDLRLCYNLDYKDDLETEALFTKYYICNPRYDYFYHNLLRKNGNEIAYCRKYKKLYMSADLGGWCISEYWRLKEAGDNERFKSLFHAYMLYCFCVRFEMDQDYEKCIMFSDFGVLETLTQINDCTFDEELNISLIGKIEQYFEDCETKYCYRRLEYDKEKIDLLGNAIVSILKLAMQSSSNSTKFFNDLTDLEKQALIVILKEINMEGTVNIGKIVEKTKISRPVFTALLNKMKQFGIAEIKGRGAAGTYIKIIESGIMSILNEK